MSDFRLFGIIIGIFDIVIGSFGNFFTILAFTRSDIQLNMTHLRITTGPIERSKEDGPRTLKWGASS